MRKITLLLFFTLLVLGANSYAQYVDKPVFITEGEFYLPNAIQSREVIRIQLPPNTKKWYYTICAYRNKGDVDVTNATYNLMAQLTKLYDYTGTTAAILTRITAPPPNDKCDIYLLSSSNEVSNFKNKLSIFSYHTEGSQERASRWRAEITSYTHGVQYLGIRNSNLGYGINIYVQVVAIVSVPATDDNGWTAADKNGMHREISNYLTSNNSGNLSQAQVDDFSTCFTRKFMSRYSASKVKSMADYEKKNALNDVLQECLNSMPGNTETNNSVVEQAQQESEYETQQKHDYKLLNEYFDRKNITDVVLTSGVYVAIHKIGYGTPVLSQQTVRINYTVRSLDGKIIDSNTDPRNPMSFETDNEKAIKGLEAGIKDFPRGTKMTIYIPSGLAYGKEGLKGVSGDIILVDTILIFDVEVLY